MKKELIKWLSVPFIALGLLVGCQQEAELLSQQEEFVPEQIKTKALIDVPPAYENIPSDAIDITTVTTLEAGQSYVILGNYSGNLPHYGNTGEQIVVYVLGTWNVQNWNLETGIDVVVTSIGTLNSSANSSLVVNGNSNIYILEGGNANFTNDFLYFSNSGSVYVYGNLTASYLQINTGTFYIAPTGYAEIGTLVSQNNGTFINEGTFIVGDSQIGGEEEDIPVYNYNVTYVPGVDLYVVDISNPTDIQFTATDNEGFGATVTTEDFNSIRLILPAGTFLTVDDLPLTLTFNAGIDELTTSIISVTLN